MKPAPELKVAEVEAGEALKGEADEGVAVISRYLPKKDIIRSYKISPSPRLQLISPLRALAAGKH